ncbi:MAG: hypothetical protein JO126_06745 [Alphaproteobacteria bacterium]|nr:hypothetical protein [Alphaproteobacteria bacterium]
MFDEIVEYYEQEAIRKLKHSAEQVRRRRMISRAMHGSFLLMGIVCFCINFVSYFLSVNYPTQMLFILAGSFGLSLILLIIVGIEKSQDEKNISIVKRAITALRWWNNKVGSDFLWGHLITVCLMTIIFVVYLIVGFAGNVLFADSVAPLSEALRTSLDKIFTAAFTILGLQVALFNFLFSQLLGKYSSSIVRTVIAHPAVRWVQGLAILNLFVPLVARADTTIWLQDKICVVLILSNLFCFLCSLSIAKIGIQADKAIIYASTAFRNEIRRKIKKPFGKSLFWSILNELGLDWRDAMRFVAIGEPRNTKFVRDRLTVLLGIAGKSIQDNQRDILNAALSAILRIADTYTQCRVPYRGKTDSVFSYLNDQMAVLLKLCSDSNNEYLVTDVTKAIGVLGFYPLDLDPLPKDPEAADHVRRSRLQQANALADSWINLLKECFDKTHVLMRSTAASECITQIRYIALKAHTKEWPYLTEHSFLAAMERIHAQCMANFNPYRLELANSVIRSILIVWLVDTSRPLEVRAKDGYHDAACKMLKKVIPVQLVLQKAFPLFFSSVATALTKKMSDRETVLQDIFYHALVRKHKEEWEKQLTLEDIGELISTVVSLSEFAIKNQCDGSDDFAEALYEFSYLVFRGLPEDFATLKSGEGGGVGRRRISYQEHADTLIFDATAKMIQNLLLSESYISGDWQHAIWGIIGHAVMAYKRSSSAYLKNGILRLIEIFYAYLKNKIVSGESVGDRDLDYLQLAGAWIQGILGEATQADEIGMFIAKYRPLSDSFFGGSSARFANMGYPELMHSDFYMPRFSGIGHELDDSDMQNMKEAEQTLMSEDVLIPFYETIRKTREPIEKKFFERARQRRAQAAEAAKNRSVKLNEENEAAKSQVQPKNDESDFGNIDDGNDKS